MTTKEREAIEAVLKAYEALEWPELYSGLYVHKVETTIKPGVTRLMTELGKLL